MLNWAWGIGHGALGMGFEFSLVTSHQSPIPSHQSPVTNPQSPVTITYSDTNPVTICKETYSAAWRK